MFNKIKIINSSDKNVKKFVFENEKSVAEAVLYKYPTYEDRTVICCSTQSGCPVGCRFCGTGEFFIKSLKSEEIVEQVDYCLNSQNIDTPKIKNFQIMVMSMGEPMLNYKELEKSFIILNNKYPQAKLLISTIAPKVDYEPLMLLSEKIDKIGLQFSIHESNDETRDKLIPFKNKLALSEMSELGEIFLARTGRKPFFNYCANIHNSTQQDANNISKIFNSNVFEATISVVCEKEESVSFANKRQKTLADDFTSKLTLKGFSTRTFDPAGQDDIGGGCGQLWYVQEWIENNKDKANKSIGYGKPIVHAPTNDF